MEKVAWSEIGQKSTDSNFVKIEEGAAVNIACIGSPVQYTQATFKSADKFKSWAIKSEDIPYFADKLLNVGVRYAIIVWDLEASAYKVLESGAQIFKQIRDLVNAGINPDQYSFKIARQGSGLATKYTVVYFPLKPDTIKGDCTINLEEVLAPKSTTDIIKELKDINVSEEDIKIKTISIIEAGEYKVGFGKYKGKTLREIKDLEPTYIDFLAKGASDIDLKAALMTIMKI